MIASLALAELVSALQRDTAHGFPDFLPGLPLFPEPERDLLPLASPPELQFPLKELGELEVGVPPLVEVRERAQVLVVGGEGSVGEVGHVVRVRAFRRPLKTRLERFGWRLDSPSRPLYGRTKPSSRAHLEPSEVVHSYRAQPADDTQKKTGRTPRLLPRRPALTNRF